MEDWTDEELFKEFCDGQREAAFQMIYSRYSGSLYRFVYRFTVNGPAAEELLHDIFEQLLKGKLQLSQDLSVKSWLFTLAKNKSLNYQKRASREVSNESALGAAPSDADIEHSYIQEDLLTQLQAAEKKLPLELLETWQLRKAGMDYQQIALNLSIPVGTVKSRFSRLIEYLKKEIKS